MYCRPLGHSKLETICLYLYLNYGWGDLYTKVTRENYSLVRGFMSNKDTLYLWYPLNMSINIVWWKKPHFWWFPGKFDKWIKCTFDIIDLCIRCNLINIILILYLCFSHTPFANGPNDTPNDILARIGEGKFSLVGGNWDSVSSLAKVTHDWCHHHHRFSWLNLVTDCVFYRLNHHYFYKLKYGVIYKTILYIILVKPDTRI